MAKKHKMDQEKKRSKAIILDLRISSDEYLKLYQGRADSVVTVARDGRTVRFPADILRKFVTRDGIQGSFVIYFDTENRFQSIDRLG